MGAPRAVARDLRRTATRIEKLVDPIVADTATFAVEAGAGGGSFGRRRLIVVVRSSSNRKGRSTATVAGKTAGGWTIQSYGRTGGYTVRPRRRRNLDLRRAGYGAAMTARPRSTRGDDRWNRLVADPTRTALVDTARRSLAEAVT